MRPLRRLSLALTLTLAATASLLLAPQHVRAYQYLQNGDFENGSVGWAAHGATLDMVDVGGNRSARLAADGGFFGLRQTAYGLGPGSYHVTASVQRAQSGTVIDLEVRALTINLLEGSISSSAGVNQWLTLTLDFNLTQFSDVAVQIRGSGPAGDVVLVDDVGLDGAAPVTPTPTDTASPTDTATPTSSGTPTRTPTPTKTPTSTRTPRSTATGRATDTPAAADGASSQSTFLRNGGFESITDGAPADWLRYGGTLSSVTSPAHGGSAAARFESTTDSTKWTYQVVAVAPGATYEFSAWIFDDDPGVKSAYLRVSWYASEDASGSAIGSADSTTKLDTQSANYRLLTTGGITSPVDARSARLRIMLAPAAGQQAATYIDDASFGPAADAVPVTDAAGSASGADPTSADGTPQREVLAASQRPSRPAARSAGAGVAATTSGAGIVINEVLYDANVSGSDADAEWVELYNATDAPVSLLGWRIADATSSDTLPDAKLGPHAFVVIAASDSFRDIYPDFTGYLLVLGGRLGNSLGNDGDALALSDANGVPMDAISWGADNSVLNPPIGDVPAGHSIERRSAGVDTNAASDFVDNESPSPGRALEARSAKPQRQTSNSTSVQALDATGGSSRVLIWIVTGASGAVLLAVLAWYSLQPIARRLRRQP